MKTKHKFPTSTFCVYTPGTGITLTRANVDMIQKERIHDGKSPFTAEQLVKYMKPPGVDMKDDKMHKRMAKRAEKVNSRPVREKH